MPPEKDVSALLIKVLQGDENAKNEVYHELLPVAIRVLKGFQNLSKEDREDIQSDGFLKFFTRSIKDFKGNTWQELKSYFSVIILNKARTFWTARQKQSQTPLEENNAATDTASSSPDVASMAADKIDFAQLLSSLSLEDKEILLLKDKGYKDREISAILNIPIGTIASRYNRAREKLAKKIQENGRK